VALSLGSTRGPLTSTRIDQLCHRRGRPWCRSEEHAMHDRCSQRDEAIRAAIHAHNNYHGECDRRRARGDTTWPEYWGYVVNAALDAVDEPRPVPPDGQTETIATVQLYRDHAGTYSVRIVHGSLTSEVGYREGFATISGLLGVVAEDIAKELLRQHQASDPRGQVP
jgi:hypothetical protein